ncbi:MAG: hypothetical protein KY460_11810 [Actinobacteria bacterium]|nr:hypothetical protein [Actinomycetota bacterium]
MGLTVAQDIALVEQLGYTRNDALDLVIRRALVGERDADDDRTGQTTARRRAYLAELRELCLARTA